MQGWKLAAVLAAMPMLGAHAAEQAAPPLSLDGARGYAGIELARVAIFDGRTADAKRLVAEAVAAFARAKDDASVFAHAEADLRAPADMQPSPAVTSAPSGQSRADAEAETARMNRAKQENSAKVWAGGAPNDGAAAAANAAAEERAAAAANAAKQETSAKVYAGNALVRWLPVSGEFGLAEDLAADPAKVAAVAEANRKLAAGDRPGALAALKRGGARGESVIALLPVDQTLADLRRASALVDGGKYLEANALLLYVLGTTRLASLDDGELTGVPTKAP